MRASRLCVAFAAVFFVLPVDGLAAGLSDDAPPMARQRYEIGKRLYRQGKFAEAAVEFRTALSLHPKSARLAFNLARALERAGDLAGAAAQYEAYLRLAPTADDAGDVRAVLASLHGQLAERKPELVLTTIPAGASVWIDGASAVGGRTPIKVRLAPGKHTLRVELAGHEAALETGELFEGRRAAVALKLKPAPGATTEPAATPTVEVEAEPEPSGPIWPWIATGWIWCAPS